MYEIPRSVIKYNDTVTRKIQIETNHVRKLYARFAIFVSFHSYFSRENYRKFDKILFPYNPCIEKYFYLVSMEWRVASASRT